MFLGDAYGVKSLAAGEEHVFWRSVRDNYQRSLDNYLDMRRRGIATGEGAGDQVTVEIAKCDAALQR
jgi:hypothetical protein